MQFEILKPIGPYNPGTVIDLTTPAELTTAGRWVAGGIAKEAGGPQETPKANKPKANKPKPEKPKPVQDEKKAQPEPDNTPVVAKGK